MDIIEEIRSGNKEAIKEVYKENAKDVYNFAKSITGNHETALEATKKTFIKLFTDIQNGDEPTNIRLAALKISYDEACRIAMPSTENIISPYDPIEEKEDLENEIPETEKEPEEEPEKEPEEGTYDTAAKDEPRAEGEAEAEELEDQKEEPEEIGAELQEDEAESEPDDTPVQDDTADDKADPGDTLEHEDGEFDEIIFVSLDPDEKLQDEEYEEDIDSGKYDNFVDASEALDGYGEDIPAAEEAVYEAAEEVVDAPEAAAVAAAAVAADAVTEDAPAEETPTEEVPAEEVPAEEVPAAEEITEEAIVEASADTDIAEAPAEDEASENAYEETPAQADITEAENTESPAEEVKAEEASEETEVTDGAEDEKPAKKKGKGGYVFCIILCIILLLLLIWFLIGLLENLGIIPDSLDLGYTWFNNTIYPLF